jgi:hypothetical protein
MKRIVLATAFAGTDTDWMRSLRRPNVPACTSTGNWGKGKVGIRISWVARRGFVNSHFLSQRQTNASVRATRATALTHVLLMFAPRSAAIGVSFMVL